MPSGRPYRCPRSFGPRSTRTASSLPQTPSITCAELLLIEKLRVLVSRPHSWCCQLRRRKTSRLPTATNTAWAEKALTYEHSHSGKLRDSHSGCLRTARVPTEGLCCAVRSGPAHPEKTGETLSIRDATAGEAALAFRMAPLPSQQSQQRTRLSDFTLPREG